MVPTQERHCPDCESTQSFTQVARMELNLGRKTKWRCDECGYQTVQIDSESVEN